MDDLVLMGDPRVAAIPVEETGEPLVALTGLPVSALKAELGADRLRVRASLAERLAAAAEALPAGYRLLVVEGWREPDVQRGYFEEYRDSLRSDGLVVDEEELHRMASRYVSPPAVAPHPSGAAIDLTLCSEDGVELDLGCPVNASPEQSRGGCFTAATGISAEGRAHRAVLSAALEGAGLVNYPTEWWHWSFGDRYWALVTGRSAARFGLTRA